jgi:hypothetical protein
VDIFGRAFSKLINACQISQARAIYLFSAGLYDQADSEADLAG